MSAYDFFMPNRNGKSRKESSSPVRLALAYALHFDVIVRKNEKRGKKIKLIDNITVIFNPFLMGDLD